MKRLKKTLALVLAVVLLISVVPFSVNAADPSASFTLAKVNGEPYDGTTPIVGGDTLTIDVTLENPNSDELVAWMLGYSFDDNGLTYGGTTFAQEWRGTSSDKGTYILIGGSIKAGSTVSGTQAVVASIIFTADSGYTGETGITANQGTKNYVSIKSGSSVQTKNIVATGCTFNIYAAVDKSVLAQKLADAASKVEADYTPNSWAAVATQVPLAQAVYDNAFATQTEVDNAATALGNALDALVLRANKLALSNTVNEGRIEAAKSEYTAESVQNLLTVIEAAQIVLDDDNATQAQVDEQTGLVRAAIDALVRNSITVRFLNYDGSVFDSQTVDYGGSATAPAENPTKPDDDTYTYTFDHWNGNFTNVTESVDIIPVFTSEKINYTITYLNEDGSEYATQTYNFGDAITAPESPTKAEDDTYTYEFAGWNPSLPETCNGNLSVSAVFTPVYKDYTIKFENYDGSEVATYTLHWGDEVQLPEDPSKPMDDTYTYNFSGWSPEVVAVAGDATYTAQYEEVYREYTIQFVNYDSSEVATYTLHWGDTVQLPDNPAKPEDDTYTYDFLGWTPEVVPVAGNAVYVAQYSETYKNYTIQFVNYDGSEVATYTLHWGDAVVAPENPSKPADDTYTYNFIGWDPEVDVVSGNITYTAQYESVYKDYTIKFENYDGSEVATYTLHWGDEVQLPADPTKPADEQYSYRFSGWSPEVVAVAGDATYTAQYEPLVNAYTVYFVNYDGETLKEVSYEYGETPVAPEDITPMKPDDDTYYYEFIGWDPAFVEVTGDAVYTAQFEAHYLDADYTAVNAAVDQAMQYAELRDNYTEVSYNRLFASVNNVDYSLKINDQAIVDAYATAILENIDKLVSPTTYNETFDKCAAVNNDNNQYTVDSYNAFLAAFAPISTKLDFNTDEATQADVDAAKAALDNAYGLLEASTLQIDGAVETLADGSLRIDANTNSLTTTLEANDGGAGTASLVFTDTNGVVVSNDNASIGTGFKVELMQAGEIRVEKYIVIYGDINGDGQISIADIRLARKMAVSTDGYTEYQIAAAKCGGVDVDVDAVIALAKA